MLKVKCPIYYTAYPTMSLETEVVDHRYQAIKPGKVIHSTDTEKYQYYVADTSEEGVYSIGARQLKDDYLHHAGYTWSSRCSVMNKLFGTRLVEVNINNCAYAMDVDILKSYMDRDLEERFAVVQYTDGDGEVSFRFIKHE